MPILPVLDLMQGNIVHGIAGQRDRYRPIVSRLVDSAEPLAVARAFRSHFGFSELYLADLDAIEHGVPALPLYRQLRQERFHLWIDAGIRSANDATLCALMEEKTHGIIVGLESVAGPEELGRIVERIGVDRTIFSLDMKAGLALGQAESWRTTDPWQIAETAVRSLGVRRLIVLDLARVGMGAGVGTEAFCARLKKQYPQVEVTTGGGVRGPDEVRRLLEMGVDYVLVASALHDGRIMPGALSS